MLSIMMRVVFMVAQFLIERRRLIKGVGTGVHGVSQFRNIFKHQFGQIF